jgi:uncharacterized membrane protein YkvA (DUF1232 family)
MFERFKILPQLWRTGHLALRLVRDPRVPLAAKVILGATVLYMISPVDVVPDWVPILGQADDLVALMAGLNLFLRACPKWLVQEHEEAIGARRDDRERHDDRLGSNDRQYAAPGPSRRTTIEGEYQRVR